MNKLLTKVVGIALGMSMAIGAGVAAGVSGQRDAQPAYAANSTISFSPSDFSAATSESTSASKSNVNIEISNGTITSDQIRVFKGETFTVSSSYDIKTISFTCTASGTSKYGPGCFTASSGYTYSGTSGTWSGTSKSIVLTASSNQVRITALSVTYDDGGQTVNVSSVSLSQSSLNLSVGQSQQLTETVLPANASDKSVTWGTSDANVATVTSGLVSAVDVGSATVTVTTTDGNKTADCNVTVGLPTVTNASVAQALTAIAALEDNGVSTGYYKVTGYVTGITTDYDSSYGNISFTIADSANESNEDNMLTCFRVKCTAEVAATILAGAQVTLTGKLEKFVKNNQTTPELVNSLPSQLEVLSSGTPIQTYVVTFSEALDIIAGLSSGEKTYDKYTVTGVITELNSAYSNGKMSFTFGETANASADATIKVYNLSISQADSATAVVGATVKVTGHLELYNSTKEIVDGSDYLLVAAPAIPEHDSRDVYDLDFTGNLESDSNTALTTTSWSNTIVGDASDLDCDDVVRVYPGANNTIKFNSSSSAGHITLVAANTVTIKRVIIHAKSFVSVNETTSVETPDTGGIKVNSSTAQSVTTEWKYYVFDLETTSNSITIEGSKASKGRFYVDDIIFVANNVQDAVGAYGYAAEFLNATDDGCANENVSSSTWSTLSTAWTTMETSYNGSQTYFASKTPNASGDIIEEALKRYEIIAVKYSLSNFMNRTLSSNVLLVEAITSNNPTIVIAIISILTLTATGGYFFLRKRKEN